MDSSTNDSTNDADAHHSDQLWLDGVVERLLSLREGESHIVSRRGRTVEVEVHTETSEHSQPNRLYVATLIDQAGDRYYRRFLHLPTQRPTDTAAVHLAQLIGEFCNGDAGFSEA